MTGVSTSVNLSLPATPNTQIPSPLFEELFNVYNAIRSLGLGLDDYTLGGLLALELKATNASTLAQLIKTRKEIAALEERIIGLMKAVNWAQPGEIGSTTPNSIAATTLTSSDVTSLADTTVVKFGANGKAAQAAINLPNAATDAATTQALANAMRTLLINFGLGA